MKTYKIRGPHGGTAYLTEYQLGYPSHNPNYKIYKTTRYGNFSPASLYAEKYDFFIETTSNPTIYEIQGANEAGSGIIALGTITKQNYENAIKGIEDKPYFEIGKANIDNWYTIGFNNFLSYNAFSDCSFSSKSDLDSMTYRTDNYKNIINTIVVNFKSIEEQYPGANKGTNKLLADYKKQKLTILKEEIEKIAKANIDNAIQATISNISEAWVSKITTKIDSIYLNNIQNAVECGYKVDIETAKLNKENITSMLPLFNQAKSDRNVGNVINAMDVMYKNYKNIKLTAKNYNKSDSKITLDNIEKIIEINTDFATREFIKTPIYFPGREGNNIAKSIMYDFDSARQWMQNQNIGGANFPCPFTKQRLPSNSVKTAEFFRSMLIIGTRNAINRNSSLDLNSQIIQEFSRLEVFVDTDDKQRKKCEDMFLKFEKNEATLSDDEKMLFNMLKAHNVDIKLPVENHFKNKYKAALSKF